MTRTISERRRLASGVAVGVASVTALTLLGGSVASFFSSTESEGQSIESGATELAIEGPGETFEFSQEIRGLAAGDSVVQYADVVNRGTVALGSFTVSQESGGPLVADPTGLDSLITSCTLPWDEASDSCAGTTSTLLASEVSEWGASAIDLPGLAIPVGGTSHLRVRTTLDAAAPNALQSEETTVRYTVRAYQTEAVR